MLLVQIGNRILDGVALIILADVLALIPALEHIAIIRKGGD